ncbi:MAG: hypothetical protein DRO36_00785 [Candidatus Hecatellales archaeon]|nr:MAG: hypothetical protein DRO36_00785 [Candidatus Hecatellales archaeon]
MLDKRKVMVGLAIGILLFSILGYFMVFEVKREAEKLTPVRIGYISTDIHHLAFFVAYYKGWYEEEGIKPVRMEYLYGMPEMMAFKAGELDAGYVGIVPAIIAKAKGANLVVVASANLEGSAIVAKPEIKNVFELDGKTVGTPGLGSIQDCMIRMVEERFNLRMNVKHYKFSDLPLLLGRGEIDAYIDWEPFCAEAVIKKIGHIIYTSHDILPNHQCCVFYVSGKLLKEKPEIAKKLVRVHVKAMRFIRENPEEAKKIFSEMTGKPLNVVDECWGRMVWDYHVNVKSIKIFVPFLIEQGKVSARDISDVDRFVESLVNTKLLAEVEKS